MAAFVFFVLPQQSCQTGIFQGRRAFWREEVSSLVEAGGTVFDAPISTETQGFRNAFLMRLAPADSIGERGLRAHFAFQRIERAVATTAAAAVTAAAMIFRSEDDVLVLDVEITGHRAR